MTTQKAKASGSLTLWGFNLSSVLAKAISTQEDKKSFILFFQMREINWWLPQLSSEIRVNSVKEGMGSSGCHSKWCCPVLTGKQDTVDPGKCVTY